MLKILNYLNRKQKRMVLLSLVFIVLQVWLDLKLPDYMSGITTLVETEGSSMKDILMQGVYMLFCALGSMAASIVTGYIAAQVAAGLAKTLRGLVYDRTLDFSMEEINRFSTSSLINRTTNDITQIQTLVAMGLQAIIKAPILAVWAIVKIYGKNWQWTLATLIPLYIFWTRFCHLGGTYWPLILPYFTGGGFFNIFLIRQFLMTVPKELDEAAEIDGASRMKILWEILVPAIRPAIVVVAMMLFIQIWNDLLQQMIYINDMDKMTFAIGLTNFTGSFGTKWNYAMAATCMTIAPGIVIYILGQKSFVEGIVLTGMKN